MVSQIMHARQIGAGAFQLAHPRAGGQQQLVVGSLRPSVSSTVSLGAMDGLGAGVQHQLAAGLGVKSVGLQEQPLALEAAQQIGLGQRRALIGRIGLVAHHGDGAGKAFGAQVCTAWAPAWPAPMMTIFSDISRSFPEIRRGVSMAGDTAHNQPFPVAAMAG